MNAMGPFTKLYSQPRQVGGSKYRYLDSYNKKEYEWERIPVSFLVEHLHSYDERLNHLYGLLLCHTHHFPVLLYQVSVIKSTVASDSSYLATS